MKKTILFMLVATPALLFAQEKYIIKGKIGTINAPAKVFLSYTENNTAITDSATIKDGVFEFSGQVDDIVIAALTLDYKGAGLQALNTGNADRIMLFLQQGTTVISGTDSLSKATLSGTRANEDLLHYQTQLKPAADASKALQAEYYSAPEGKRNSQAFAEYIRKKGAKIQQQLNELNEQFIAANPDALIGFQSLIDRLNTESYPDATYLQAQFSKLSQSLRESKAGVAFQQRLDVLNAVAIGAIAPDFTQPDTTGTLVKLSSFRGKYVLLDFWASWCGPCRNENPNLVKAYNNFKEKNFTILSVSLDQPGKKDSWLNAIHADGLKWNHVSDLKFWSNDAAVLYGVRAIPQNLLIDPDGKIVAKNIFGEDLQNKLKEILGSM
ncbi:TlpA disulfide reductase family protein [Mucilaginibacter sp.]|uniref:TlpA disulfide reductase family protein n=1 Tax=Mucilaginibacter sp. TaxID=1882438 RepID=UPI00283C8254|nr:TlpA disulfide reductase family protein [Mucilaginibacter sp.]MDR3694219.1 TlpA disulfide reductase family protein [Mucilaginibacter sp.]